MLHINIRKGLIFFQDKARIEAFSTYPKTEYLERNLFKVQFNLLRMAEAVLMKDIPFISATKGV